MENKILYCYTLEKSGENLEEDGNQYFFIDSLANLPLIGDELCFCDGEHCPPGIFKVLGRRIEKANLKSEFINRVIIYIEEVD